MQSRIRAKKWAGPGEPKKVLAMRFQALGDTIITLPYLNDFKRKHPEVKLHFLTRKEVGEVPSNIDLFDKIIIIGGGRNLKLQFLWCMLKLPALWLEGYDVILDLQNHKISRILRRLLSPRSFAEFDRESANSAGERTRLTIDAVGLGPCSIYPTFKFKSWKIEGLIKNGGQHFHVILNPAGYCASRNWPLQSYVDFATLWLRTVDANTTFLLLLLPSLKRKADFIRTQLGNSCIDLTGKADQVSAFQIISKSHLMISEDSGLMHMAWTQGIPTVALFSSSRKDWSAPQGDRSVCLDSSDLECGPCGSEICVFGDNRCIARYEPDMVLTIARDLVFKQQPQ